MPTARILNPLRYLVMPLALTWPALLVFALHTDTLQLAAQGDYAKIDSLRYTVVPSGFQWTHAVPPAQGANIAKLQQYLRDGIDGEPLSQQYLRIVAGESDGLFGDITRFHSLSSPRLLWQLLHDHGAPPQSQCTTLFTRITPAMDTAAAPFKVGGLVGYETLGTYQLAVAHLAANPGSALLLSTDGYDTRTVIGLKGGLSVWLEYPRPGPPVVVLRDEAAGAQVWKDQLFDQVNGPADYMLVIESR